MVGEIEVDTDGGGIERAFELSKGRWGPTTQSSYKAACDDFANFCRDRGVPALPASPETIVAFLRARASTHSIDALAHRNSVIRALHTDAKGRLPKDDPDRDRFTLDDPIIAAAWKDIKREGDEQVSRAAVRSQELEAILRQIPDDPKGIQDRAALCVGLAYALRRSEIVALDRDDLEINDETMLIRIRCSERKQDLGYDTRMAARTRTVTCAVAAMERWLEAGKIIQGAVFSSTRGNRMEGRYVATILQQYGAKAGFDPKALGAQSLRTGHILERIQAHDDPKTIMEFARVKSVGYFEYRDAEVARRDTISSEELDIAQIAADESLSQEEKKTLIAARRGQGKFRDDLRKRWGDACAVTGCTVLEVLKASHIQPWSGSTNAERLNPFNGLLLSANLDALFDKHLISFQDDGQMLVASQIDESNRRLLGVYGRLLKPLTNEEKHFLAKHRTEGGFAKL
jgi:site-specific recombinase XerD